MHRAAFAWAGLDGQYDALRVTPDELPGRLAALRHDPAVLGVNLSLPHKETALALLDTLSDAARQIGAVNTVVRQGGALHGHNTDAPGLLEALRDAGMLPTGKQPVVILGAGGAARAAFYVMQQLNLPTFVVNRSPERAEVLIGSFGPKHEARALNASQVPWEKVRLIINSTSAGLGRPDETPLPDFNFHRCPRAGVYDMVYQPAETRLMREARAAGLPAENGLGMLAHQARLAFCAWTGVDVPLPVFRGALTRGPA